MNPTKRAKWVHPPDDAAWAAPPLLSSTGASARQPPTTSINHLPTATYPFTPAVAASVHPPTSQYPNAGFYALDATLADGSLLPFHQLVDTAVLIVNVASRCGFAHTHYGQLQEMYDRFAGQPLSILAFPCNQFGSQEPSSDIDILKHVEETYGSQHLTMAKIDVNGPSAHPVYTFLKAQTTSEPIAWNFRTYFLVSPSGTHIRRFDGVEPLSLTSEIEAILPAPALPAAQQKMTLSPAAVRASQPDSKLTPTAARALPKARTRATSLSSAPLMTGTTEDDACLVGAPHHMSVAMYTSGAYLRSFRHATTPASYRTTAAPSAVPATPSNPMRSAPPTTTSYATTQPPAVPVGRSTAPARSSTGSRRNSNSSSSSSNNNNNNSKSSYQYPSVPTTTSSTQAIHSSANKRATSQSRKSSASSTATNTSSRSRSRSRSAPGHKASYAPTASRPGTASSLALSSSKAGATISQTQTPPMTNTAAATVSSPYSRTAPGWTATTMASSTPRKGSYGGTGYQTVPPTTTTTATGAPLYTTPLKPSHASYPPATTAARTSSSYSQQQYASTPATGRTAAMPASTATAMVPYSSYLSQAVTTQPSTQYSAAPQTQYAQMYRPSTTAATSVPTNSHPTTQQGSRTSGPRHYATSYSTTPTSTATSYAYATATSAPAPTTSLYTTSRPLQQHQQRTSTYSGSYSTGPSSTATTTTTTTPSSSTLTTTTATATALSTTPSSLSAPATTQTSRQDIGGNGRNGVSSTGSQAYTQGSVQHQQPMQAYAPHASYSYPTGNEQSMPSKAQTPPTTSTSSTYASRSIASVSPASSSVLPPSSTTATVTGYNYKPEGNSLHEHRSSSAVLTSKNAVTPTATSAIEQPFGKAFDGALSTTSDAQSPQSLSSRSASSTASSSTSPVMGPSVKTVLRTQPIAKK